MGIFGTVNRLFGAPGHRIAESNAPSRDLNSEWLYGRFSRVIVGESNYTDAFTSAYQDLFAPEKARDRMGELTDIVRVELRRQPNNPYDSNAIQAWVLGSDERPAEWLGGYVAKAAAARIAPTVDRLRLRSWQHPGIINGSNLDSAPKYGVIIQPGRRLTPGPDLGWLLSDSEWAYLPPSDNSIDYFIRLVEDLPREDRRAALSLFGIDEPTWKDADLYAKLWDARQLSTAIDTLTARLLSSPWRATK